MKEMFFYYIKESEISDVFSSEDLPIKVFNEAILCGPFLSREEAEADMLEVIQEI